MYRFHQEMYWQGSRFIICTSSSTCNNHHVDDCNNHHVDDCNNHHVYDCKL